MARAQGLQLRLDQAAEAKTPSPSSADTTQERLTAAQQRWAQYEELMRSSDPIAQAEGFSAAVADDNLGVRNNALWTYLQGRDRLPITVVAEPGGRAGPGDLPKLALSEITWNKQQRASKAFFTSFGVRSDVTGLVVAGKLQLTYSQLTMPDFVGQLGNRTSDETKYPRRRCDTVLALNAAHDALESRLVCEGMPQSLSVNMHLG